MFYTYSNLMKHLFTLCFIKKNYAFHLDKVKCCSLKNILKGCTVYLVMAEICSSDHLQFIHLQYLYFILRLSSQYRYYQSHNLLEIISCNIHNA